MLFYREELMKRTVLAVGCAVAISSGLAGCATSTLTQTQAAQYASMGLPEFLSARFNNSKPLSANGSVIYEAYFNHLNYRQLERPTTELQYFCQAGGGVAKRIAAYNGNPLGKSFAALRQVVQYQEMPVAVKLYGSGNDLGSAWARNDFMAGKMMKAASDTGLDVANKGWNEVKDKGLYGIWKCQYSDNRPQWAAAVIPQRFIPSPDAKDPLFSPEILIEIAPYMVN